MGDADKDALLLGIVTQRFTKASTHGVRSNGQRHKSVAAILSSFHGTVLVHQIHEIGKGLLIIRRQASELAKQQLLCCVHCSGTSAQQLIGAYIQCVAKLREFINIRAAEASFPIGNSILSNTDHLSQLGLGQSRFETMLTNGIGVLSAIADRSLGFGLSILGHGILPPY